MVATSAWQSRADSFASTAEELISDIKSALVG
jgi:hypothetical protein